MKIFKKVFLFILTMMLLCFISVIFFFITDRGVYLMLRTFIDWVPGLQVGVISGNFLHGVTLKNVSYQRYGVLIKSTELYLTVDFCYLWDKRVYINSIFFKDILMNIEVSNFDTILLVFQKNKIINRILNLYTLVCRNIILNNISIKLDEMMIMLNTCHTGLIWDKNSCTILPTFFSELKLSNYSNFKYYNQSYLHKCSLKKILSCKSSISSIFEDFFSTLFLKKKI